MCCWTRIIAPTFFIVEDFSGICENSLKIINDALIYVLLDRYNLSTEDRRALKTREITREIKGKGSSIKDSQRANKEVYNFEQGVKQALQRCYLF